MSILNVLKDSVDFLNELYFLHRNNFQFIEFLKSISQYYLPVIKNIFIYFIKFQWIYDFMHIPVSTTSYKIQNFSEYLYFNIELSNRIIPTNSFFSGLLKSIPIYITFSSIQLLTILRLLIEGHLAAIISVIGTIFGYIIFIILNWLGLRQLVTIWYSYEPLSYIFGVSTFFMVLFRLMHKPIRKFKFWDEKELLKIGLTSCFLVFTEQTSLFYYFDNISLQPNISFVDNFGIENLIFYIFGFAMGSISLSIFVALIAIAIEKLIVQYFSVSYVKYLRKVNFLFITLFVALNITSFPFYGIDYLALSPLGFVSKDEALAKFLANTSFPDFQQGRLGESSAFTSVDTDLTPFDRTRYLTGQETEFTFEDFNYESEYAWKTRVDRLSSTTYSGRPVNQFLRKFLPNRVLVKQDFPEVTKIEPEKNKIDNNVFNLLSFFKGLTERFFEDYNDEVLDLSYPVFEVENEKMPELNHEYNQSELADKRQYEQLQLHKLELLKQARINREKRKLEILRNELLKSNLDKNEKNLNYSSQYTIPKLETDGVEFSNERFSAFSELLKYGFDSFSIFQEFEADLFEEHLSRKIKKKYYLNNIYRNLLNSDILDFLNRDYKHHRLTDEDENNLVFKRFALNRYYNTLRDYINTQYYLAFKELFKGPKSYLNRIYNHQFNGTLKIVRRLFLLNNERRQIIDFNDYDIKYLEYYLSNMIMKPLKRNKIFISPLKLRKKFELKKKVKQTKEIRAARKEFEARFKSRIPTGIPGVMKPLPILQLDFSPEHKLERKQREIERILLFKKRYRLYLNFKKQLKAKFFRKFFNQNLKKFKKKVRISGLKLANLSTSEFNFLYTLSLDSHVTKKFNYVLNFGTKIKHNLFNNSVFLYKEFLTYLKSKALLLNIFKTDAYKKLILFKQEKSLIEPTKLYKFETKQTYLPQVKNVEKFHNLNLYYKEDNFLVANNNDFNKTNLDNSKGNKNYDSTNYDNASFTDVRDDAINNVNINNDANHDDQIYNDENRFKELTDFINNFDISDKTVKYLINQVQRKDSLVYKNYNYFSNFKRSDYLNSLQYSYILNKLKNHFEVYIDENVENLVSESIRKYIFKKIRRYNPKIRRNVLKRFLKNHLVILNFRKYKKKLNFNRLKFRINLKNLNNLNFDMEFKFSELDSFITKHINDIERVIDLETIDDINLNAYQFEQPLIESRKEKIKSNDKNIKSLIEKYNTILKFDKPLYKQKAYEPNYLLHEELIEDYFNFQNSKIEIFNYYFNYPSFNTFTDKDLSKKLLTDDQIFTDLGGFDPDESDLDESDLDESDLDEPDPDGFDPDESDPDESVPGGSDLDFEIEKLTPKQLLRYELKRVNNFNSPFIQEENISPFFAGWDFKNRKFIITNSFLPEKETLRKVNQSEIFSNSTKNDKKLKFTLWPLSPPKNPKIRMSRYYSEPEMQHQIDLFDIFMPKNEEQQEEAQMLYQALPNLIDRIDLQNQDKQLRKLNPKVGGLNWLGQEELKVDFEYIFKKWSRKIKNIYKNFKSRG
uniref:Ycf1 n=1 Tax=Avrainvillea sp. HV04061 TaxID=2364086 RepID=A0A3B8DCF4_9CHLO|nr:hypothetical protein Ycf1 [Avrainvillea sp. HV04061]